MKNISEEEATARIDEAVAAERKRIIEAACEIVEKRLPDQLTIQGNNTAHFVYRDAILLDLRALEEK